MNTFNQAHIKGRIISKNINEPKEDFFTLKMIVDCGNNNRVNVDVLNSGNNPNRITDIDSQFEVNDYIHVQGRIQQRQYKDKDGKSKVARSVQGFMFNASPFKEEKAVFILQGNVGKVMKKEVEGKPVVGINVITEDEYEDKVYTNTFLLTARDEVAKEAAQLGEGDNVKFKGYVLQELLRDEFEDIIGYSNEFGIQKIESVKKASKENDVDEVPF